MEFIIWIPIGFDWSILCIVYWPKIIEKYYGFNRYSKKIRKTERIEIKW
jgi:hypothetical protein